MPLYDCKFIDHFFARVNIRDKDSCWEWSAGKDSYGYGVLWDKSAKMVKKAHRVSFEAAFGNIPDGMGVLHKCDNPSCVNPNHLFLGTQVDNIADMKLKGRVSQRSDHFKTHLTEEDVSSIREKWGNRSATQAELANQYNISNQQISRIVNMKSWARGGGIN